MQANVVASGDFTNQAVAAVAAVPDWTDAPATVYLVAGSFDPADSDTYPTALAAFTPLTAGDPWAVVDDIVTGTRKMVAPDPDGGWTFTSSAGGVTVTGFVVVSSAEAANFIGANLFATPIPVSAAGQEIVLPYVDFDVTQIVGTSVTPYPLV